MFIEIRKSRVSGNSQKIVRDDCLLCRLAISPSVEIQVLIESAVEIPVDLLSVFDE